MCEDKECGECEHWDGKDCRNGEKLMAEAEAKEERGD